MATPGDVDQEGVVGEQVQRVGVDDATGLGGEGQGDYQKVCFGQQLGEEVRGGRSVGSGDRTVVAAYNHRRATERRQQGE